MGAILGVLWLSGFLAAGALIVLALGRGPFLIRLWLGMIAGLTGAMWLPALFSFLFGFSLPAQYLAFSLAVLAAAAGCVLLRKKGPVGRPDKKDVPALVVTFLITGVIAALNVTHTLMPSEEGYLVGQSTYGDLCLHVGIATGLAQQGVFPPEYTIYPGARLSYPFLADSLSASLLVVGAPLRLAFILPGTVCAMLLVFGFYQFAYRVTKRTGVSVLATLLFFFNGGFGFAYFFDMLKVEPENLSRLFGYYTTPTNYVDRGLKWVNMICDMLVPQRTTLFGYTLLFADLYLLHAGLTEKKRSWLLFAGILAGLMPMVHTHSYLALGLAAFGFIFFLYDRRGIGKWVVDWLHFGLPAVLIALPQLLFWTFGQATGEHFLRFSLDWDNSTDFWLWFWIKNLGLAGLAILPALIHERGIPRRTALSGLTIFIVSSLFLFQPNPYDNNKLLYVWYALTLPCVSAFFADCFLALEKHIRSTRLIALGMGVILFLSSGMTLAREFQSRYVLFSPAEIAAADFIRDHTEKDAVFLTGDQHCNAVSTLAGRSIYCGTPIYLHFHGIDYADRAAQADAWFANASLLAGQNAVQYVYYSSWEKSRWPQADLSGLECVYDTGGVSVYRVP